MGDILLILYLGKYKKRIKCKKDNSFKQLINNIILNEFMNLNINDFIFYYKGTKIDIRNQFIWIIIK